MELEKTVNTYRTNKQPEVEVSRKENMYRGISVLEERSFNKGGTSIKYWM